MQVSYECPTVCETTVEVDESDLQAMESILREAFVDRLRVIGLSNPCYKYEEKVIEICKRYGVDPSSKLAVTSFFKALLGV